MIHIEKYLTRLRLTFQFVCVYVVSNRTGISSVFTSSLLGDKSRGIQVSVGSTVAVFGIFV